MEQLSTLTQNPLTIEQKYAFACSEYYNLPYYKTFKTAILTQKEADVKRILHKLICFNGIAILYFPR